MMIDLDDKQKQLLLETLGVAHIIKYMKGEDNSDLEELIEKMADSLKKEGKMHIFEKVFQDLKK